jgi:multiple sugar transport system ATP-binding protein
MAIVRYEQASRVYAAGQLPAVDRLTLQIADGEFCVLVGPSGSGKSTALRMLAGLEPVDGGSVHIGERDVTDLMPKQRDIAMVFQNYALYPHMTVRQNMGFALAVAKINKAEVRRRVDIAADLLELQPYLDRRPKELSGGQRQRVAMGRAIVREPQVFLMDEPLSNLDAKLRVSTRTQIATLQRRLGVTTVYVTHDQVEAMTMGDRVAVLKDGLLQQFDVPLALYDRPANLFVAGFIGSPAMNLLTVPLSSGGALFGTSTIPLTPSTTTAAAARGLDTVVIGARPEAVRVTAAEDRNATIEVTVVLVEELGADAYVYGETADGTRVTVRVDGRTPPDRGSRLWLHLPSDALHVFDPASGDRL